MILPLSEAGSDTQADYFKALLLRPLKNGNPETAKLLQALVGQTLLRRTKDSKDASGRNLVELPPLDFFRCSVELDTETRAMYDEIAEAGRRRLEAAMRTGQVRSPASNTASLTL